MLLFLAYLTVKVEAGPGSHLNVVTQVPLVVILVHFCILSTALVGSNVSVCIMINYLCMYCT